ncbi:MAG TPA: FecR family protein [Spirochaetales bacterium]|nr:FecR family protein [Spirochaetales bacterium]
MKATTYALAAGLLAALTPSWAQSPAKAAAEIVYFEGKDLSVLRAGKPLSVGDPIGLELFQDDQVQTGPKSTAEILLKAKGAVVKLSENTVLSLRGLGAETTSLELLYGRVRSKVAKLAAKDSFEIRSSSVVAGVRGTDFGCDLVAPRSLSGAAGSGSAPLVRVYCFSGSVEVSLQPLATPAAAAGPAAAASAGAPPAPLPLPAPILVEAGKMVLVDLGSSPAASAPPPLEAKPLDEDLRRFWTANDFESLEVSGAAVPALLGAAVPAPAAFDFAAARASLARKNASLTGGLALAAVGAALGASSLFIAPNDAELGSALGLAGALCSGASVPVLIFSLSVNPLAAPRKSGEGER